MLTITARLLHGTIRAGSPDDTVMAGGDAKGEWPPSPARLFSALVAGDGTRSRCRLTDGRELAAVEQLGPPRIYADALDFVEWTDLPPRYVVIDERKDSTVRDYPARTSSEVRPGRKASPRIATVAYVWDADLDEDVVAALRIRARRIGYFGCADSPVQVTVSRAGPPDGLVEWTPGALHGGDSAVELPVPYPGFTDQLDAAYDAAARRAWVPNRWERYAPPGVDQEDGAMPTVIWLEFARAVAGRRSLLVATTLRDALLDLVDRRLPGRPEDSGRRAPWVLHGHGVPPDARRYQLARYLPLSNVGHPHADGAIHGAAVWLPPGCEAETVEAVRAAAFDLRRLVAPGIDVPVAQRSGGRGRRSTQPGRWTGPCERWFSATPAVAERGRRGGPSPDDVRSWFEHAGHPVPTAVRVSPVPTAPGVPRLHPREVHRAGKDRHPFFWLEVLFAEPVEGPLCVGRSRSFGMGLLAPALQRSR